MLISVDKPSGANSSEFNNAFLNSRKISVKSSASSATSGVPSFHSRSFEGPSKISSTSSENVVRNSRVDVTDNFITIYFCRILKQAVSLSWPSRIPLIKRFSSPLTETPVQVHTNLLVKILVLLAKWKTEILL